MKISLFPLLGFLLMCPVAFGQKDDVQGTDARPHLHADCRKFVSPGCKSFNAMAATHNPDLQDILDTADHSLVCFRQTEDVFFVITYDHVQDAAFAGHEPGYKLLSVVNFERFKKQAGDTVKGFLGSWHKDPEGIRFSIDPQKNEASAKADVSKGEVSFSYQYHGPSTATAGSGPPSATDTITYDVTVHLSTLHFVERFTKTGHSVHTSAQNTGACASF